ncbi:MAG: single-stranded-DNA-specific exonuclease RecJ [Azospirillum sp.]|nr:single-stranded-DNA-specific exonuclease RecJ [Alphaproteobacteria bacterium]MBS6996757.1 single-stranded-DNA-specific exonuclease RecJ [Azospirillum sp.]
MAFDFENKKSLGGNIWKAVPVDERKAELIAQRFALPLPVARIIASRGIPVDDVANFINPKLQNLMPDPFCMKDMEKAAKRIAEAIVKKQKVAIIGDYDVDGATSSSVLRLYLESVGIEPEIHIPERDEGYGPSRQAFDEFAAFGAELVITVDCGTTAFDVFDYAGSLNIPVIVLDHHEAEVRLPEVYAVVNPKRLDESDDYPYLKYMAAVGVVFCTIVAVNRELRKQGFFAGREEPNLLQWLDLVALGTVCDVVPLLGLNRAFVRQGLRIMSLRSNTGLRALIDKSGISEAPSAFHLGYVLGPRINACGRVGEASLGNKLLCSRDDFQAGQLADKLNEFNAQRKEIEAYVLLSAIEMLEGTPQEYPIAFAAGKDWHQGVVGIVAGKLKERYNVPAFVMSIEPDEVKGSARSVPGVDLGALIIAAKEKGLLTKGGGHTMAAGFSLPEDKIEAFRRFAGEYVRQKLGEEDVAPVIEVDSALDLLGANTDFAAALELLEPFGAGNAEPKIVLEHVRVVKPGIVGAGHVRCFLTSGNGGSLKAMAFKIADTELGKTLLNSQGAAFDIAGVLRRDNWQGRNSVQFIIDDAIRCE